MGSHVVLVVLALSLLTVAVSIGTSALLRRNLETTAYREAELFVPLLQRTDDASATALTERSRDVEAAFGARVRIIRPGDPAAADDPAVARALTGRTPEAVWGEHPLIGERAVSVVVPVRVDGGVRAVVQVVAPSAEIDAEVRDIWRFSLLAGLAVVVLATGVALLLAGTVSRPVQRLTEVARRHGDGDYDAVAAERGPPEIALLARTLNRSAHRTAALIDAQRAFVADASHQLRTPLAAMRLTLDTVRVTVTDPAAEPRLDAVDREIQRMNQLVESLLTLARAETVEHQRRVLDLAALVEDRVEVWSAAFDDADLVAVVENEGALWIEASAGALEQVLDNVLDNAVGVSPPGGRIEVHGGYEPYRVVLTITDQGPGLTEAERARAFDRFWTTRPGQGSGLGLAVVRQLVERDGGDVALLAAPDGGLTVRFSWPRRDPA
ncbi:ATP-binding protein [Nocardioides sp.]|uniref:HAMP domain-containing sensor histidine kinase n=1 Tax=Nocardioides sp. TaxID=35761 RepID=UPI00351689FC